MPPVPVGTTLQIYVHHSPQVRIRPHDAGPALGHAHAVTSAA